ncbi:hydroxyproline-rich glycoprotein family protein [Actinidia rufa]|uniref:Hydroxyproline-rich glycoprotein family protein n=1 Tax=Actinidia rufa TaxID=165716 RepID=A0A7J0G2G0_9ERIC|nr:hydroxyproline-rich glycoprotein family protein [Actinidia rufa]
MANENEPAKLLLPYLQRADELQKHEPLVAYYCRLYAMERGLKIPQSERTKTTNSLLISLMNQLEKDKKSVKLGPDDHLHLEGFALNVFAKADKQDRAGRADLNTAKTFYAASIFFEIVNQFGELQPDLEQKQKYAVWKAADIRKAMKEGRKPVPGPPGGDKDLSILSNTSGEYDLEPSRIDPTIKPSPEPDPSPRFTEASLPTVPSNYPSYHQGTDATHSTPPAPTTTNYPPPAQYNSSSRNGTVSEPAPAPTKTYHYDSNYEPSPEKIAEAHKAARFAVGALAFDDVSTAVDYLKKSLELLTNPSAGP